MFYHLIVLMKIFVFPPYTNLIVKLFKMISCSLSCMHLCIHFIFLFL